MSTPYLQGSSSQYARSLVLCHVPCGYSGPVGRLRLLFKNFHALLSFRKPILGAILFVVRLQPWASMSACRTISARYRVRWQLDTIFSCNHDVGLPLTSSGASGSSKSSSLQTNHLTSAGSRRNVDSLVTVQRADDTNLTLHLRQSLPLPPCCNEPSLQ